MDKAQDALLRRPLYLFDLPQDILDSLAPKPDAGLPALDEEDGPTNTTPSGEPITGPVGTENVLGSQACSLCGMAFATVQEQREHLKTDLHYYNLKQKMNGLKPVSEAEFEKLVEENDVSISGSDTSDNEDEEDEPSRKESTLSALLKKQASLAEKRNPDDRDQDEEPRARRRGTGKPPLLWFTSPKLPEHHYFGIYRAMFTAEELDKEDAIIEAIKQRQLPPISMPKAAKDGITVPPAYNGRHIFLCMMGGGHFAAMVVCLAPKQSKHGSTGPPNREAVVLAHKTFHRYTTRRKQGGSQSANDNAKGAAHSAGASLRRYNEQALVEDVRELLSDWKALIDTSDLLFIRATGSTNRRTLFGPYDGQVLRPNDSRIRGFPFSTRRATQNELMRAFIELTRLKLREIQPEAPTPGPADETAKGSKPKADSKPAAPKLSEEEEAAIFHTTQIQAMIRRSKLPALLSYLTTNNLPPDFRFQPADSQQNHHAPTPLHLAAAQNSAPLVGGLFARAGADPTILSPEGKTPFDLAGDRATRDAFRVARAELGEAAWDWDKARVPAPLRREEAEQRAERERQTAEREEALRRAAEEERLRVEGPRVDADRNANSKKKSGKTLLGGGGPPKTAEERRAEEARGLTPEQRMRLERERRARAAEERIKRMQGGG
ncbi:hypothetical protein C7999DRAFT_15218 [Corynascus novoguineensis]|uniref:VLRF1 domain-containing protein n=1 Tax=Corynascus novoguineensis TaxID=1126955 RepID=A0AAN7CSP7_9PEZI|nr:hypothetical protein C7999DRAFT_15218 [Corynascus novoguineensis]